MRCGTANSSLGRAGAGAGDAREDGAVKPEPDELLAYRQLQKDVDKVMMKKIQERVDVVAMYLFPAIFLCFNLCYWPYYLLL